MRLSQMLQGHVHILLAICMKITSFLNCCKTVPLPQIKCISEERKSLIFTHQWSDGCYSIWEHRAQSECGSLRTGPPEKYVRKNSVHNDNYFPSAEKGVLISIKLPPQPAFLLVSGCVSASYTFSICLSQLLTVDHVNFCSLLGVQWTAMLAIVGFVLDLWAVDMAASRFIS